MKSHVGRLYAFAVTLLVFFVTWALVATRPWAESAGEDPRLERLAKREEQLKAEAVRVQGIVERRWAVYLKHLAKIDPKLAAKQRKQIEKALRSGKTPRVSLLAVTVSPSSKQGKGGSGGGGSGGGGSGGGGSGGSGDGSSWTASNGGNSSGSSGGGSSSGSNAAAAAAAAEPAAAPEPAAEPAPEAAPPPEPAPEPVTETGSS